MTLRDDDNVKSLSVYVIPYFASIVSKNYGRSSRDWQIYISRSGIYATYSPANSFHSSQQAAYSWLAAVPDREELRQVLPS